MYPTLLAHHQQRLKQAPHLFRLSLKSKSRSRVRQSCYNKSESQIPFSHMIPTLPSSADLTSVVSSSSASKLLSTSLAFSTVEFEFQAAVTRTNRPRSLGSICRPSLDIFHQHHCPANSHPVKFFDSSASVVLPFVSHGTASAAPSKERELEISQRLLVRRCWSCISD